MSGTAPRCPPRVPPSPQVRGAPRLPPCRGPAPQPRRLPPRFWGRGCLGVCGQRTPPSPPGPWARRWGPQRRRVSPGSIPAGSGAKRLPKCKSLTSSVGMWGTAAAVSATGGAPGQLCLAPGGGHPGRGAWGRGSAPSDARLTLTWVPWAAFVGLGLLLCLLPLPHLSSHLSPQIKSLENKTRTFWKCFSRILRMLL